MKFMILVSGPSSHGKTQSIVSTYRAFHFNKEQIITNEGSMDLSESNEIYIKVQHQGKIIGFCSQGDPYTSLSDKLQEFASSQECCDIILTACRTKGETIDSAFEIAEAEGYEIIQTSTFYLHNQNSNLQHVLNESYAFGLKHLIETLLNY